MLTEAKKYEFMVGKFIEAFNLKFPGTEYFFTNGGCKIFADILQGNFPDGKIMHYDGHYLFKFKERFYDVNGEYIIEDESGVEDLGFCKVIEDRMDSYENIFEMCMYNLMQRSDISL